MSGDAPLERELLEQVAEVTLPTAREMEAVIQGTAAPAPKSRPLWWLVLPGLFAVAGFAAVVALVAVIAWSARFGPLDIEVGESRWVGPSRPLRIGPALEVSGAAKVAVEEARVTGVRVAVQRGTAWFRQSSGPPVVVRLGEADIAFGDGTIEVSRNDRGGVVRVLSGLVHWKRGDRSEALHPGDWRGFAADSAPAVWAPLTPLPDPGPAPEPEPDVASVEPEPEPEPEPAEPSPKPPAPAPKKAAPALPKPGPVPRDVTAPKPKGDAQEWTEVLDALDSGGTPADHVARLDAFIARHPQSSFRSEAEYWRLQQRTRLAAPSQAVAEMEAWIEAWPEAPRALDVRFLHATTSRESLGDCKRALPNFREVAGYDKVGRAGQALAGQGLCASDQGRAVEARWALERALERDIPAPLREEVLRKLQALNEAADR